MNSFTIKMMRKGKQEYLALFETGHMELVFSLHSTEILQSTVTLIHKWKILLSICCLCDLFCLSTTCISFHEYMHS